MQDYKDSEEYKALKDFIINEFQKQRNDDFDDNDAEFSSNEILRKIFQHARLNNWLIEGIDYDQVFAIDDTEYENGFFINEDDDDSYCSTEEVLQELGYRIHVDEIKADPRLVELFEFHDKSFSQIVQGEEDEDDE